MNSPLDSIRPTTQAELPALAHVTSREEQRRKDLPKKPVKKERRQQVQSPRESAPNEPASSGDDSTGSIDLLA